MILKVHHIKEIMEDYAPTVLKESYDNVGLMVGDFEDEVRSILVALDCTMDVIDEAIEKKCNLIITHHPLLFIKPQSITTETLQGKKLLKLIKNNLNLYSCHTNLDSVKGGLNDIVVNLLGYSKWDIIEPSGYDEHNKEQGIGRLVTLDNPVTLGELCDNVKKSLDIPVMRFAGQESMCIKKIAVVNGSGEDFFEASVKMGADCIITGDTTYHYFSDYKEMGIGIIDAGHFETEWPCMKVMAHILQEKITFLGFNCPVVISKRCKSPYKFV